MLDNWQMHSHVNKVKFYMLTHLFCAHRRFIQRCLHVGLFIINNAWVTFIYKLWDLLFTWTHTVAHAISWYGAEQTHLCSGGWLCSFPAISTFLSWPVYKTNEDRSRWSWTSTHWPFSYLFLHSGSSDERSLKIILLLPSNVSETPGTHMRSHNF